MFNLRLPFLRSVFLAALVVFGLFALRTWYFGPNSPMINADGEGYYDYLPSLFIHHDLSRQSTEKNPAQQFPRIYSKGVYVDIDSLHRVDKYPCGVALLQLPFFGYAYFTTARTGQPDDGYQPEFHSAVFAAALFYLFLALFFFEKLLLTYGVRRWLIFFMQIVLALGTGVTSYATHSPSFSHVYSLFAITLFLYFVRRLVLSSDLRYFTAACVTLGLIALLRNVNVLVVLMVPFLAGSRGELVTMVKNVWQSKMRMLSGFLLFFAIVFIQLFLWHIQTGRWVLDSYPGEHFNFAQPRFIDILFSFNKGFFIYTPVCVLAFAGWIYWLVKREYFIAISWFLFFIGLNWFLSSWHAWNYGGGFGLRAYIDFYPLFFIPIAVLLEGLAGWRKIPVMAVMGFFVFVNIVQSYQYQHFILHHGEMDRERYAKVFLKQGDQFRGLLWGSLFTEDFYNVLYNDSISEVKLGPNSVQTIRQKYSYEIPGFESASLLAIDFGNDFDENSLSKLTLHIKDTTNGLYVHFFEIYLMHACRGPLNTFGKGLYYFQLPPMKKEIPMTMYIELRTGNREEKLKNFRMRLLTLKPPQ